MRWMIREIIVRQADGVGKNWLMRLAESNPRVVKLRCLRVCGPGRIISKTALYLLEGIDTMSFSIMKANEAYEQTNEVIKEQNRIERELAEEFIQSVFVPALADAIKRGRYMLKLSITPEVNAYKVSEVLRENGYKTRVSCGRSGVGKSSINVFWNPEAEDDF